MTVRKRLLRTALLLIPAFLLASCMKEPVDISRPENAIEQTLYQDGKEVSPFVSVRDMRDITFEGKSEADLYALRTGMTEGELAALPEERRERLLAASPEIDEITGLPKEWLERKGSSETTITIRDHRGEVSYAEFLAELHPEEIAALSVEEKQIFAADLSQADIDMLGTAKMQALRVVGDAR